MKKYALIILLMMVSGCSVSSKKEWTFDFEKDNSSFKEIFADYHDDGNNYTTYEMTFGREMIPGQSNSQALFINGSNRSDDLFMGFSKQLDGLKKDTLYHFTLSFVLGTSAEACSIGIGGSPADSVYMKAGFVNEEPKVAFDENMIFRLNIDKGNQSEGGLTLPVVSTMAKAEGSKEGYGLKTIKVEIDLKSNADGSVYLVIGSDSGYEGLTRYYLDDVLITATQK